MCDVGKKHVGANNYCDSARHIYASRDVADLVAEPKKRLHGDARSRYERCRSGTTNKRTKARFIERAPGDRSLRGVFVAKERPQMNLVSMYLMVLCERLSRGL